MKEFVPITIANGDGVGSEIMESLLHILMEAGARVRLELIEVGEKLYAKNYVSGIAEDTLESIARTSVLLKAPITIPTNDNSYLNLSDTLKKVMSLNTNISSFISYYPFVKAPYSGMDILIISENYENKLDYEEIIKFTFEFAIKNNRKKVSYLDNITELPEEIFYKTFVEIAKEYPQIESEYHAVNIDDPNVINKIELYDVILATKHYSNILINLLSVTNAYPLITCCADIGEYYSMFQAGHGPMEDKAGQNIVNPSSLLYAAIMMLRHIDQDDIASLIENAWKKTIQNGIHTSEIYNENISSIKVGTKEFAAEIIKRL